MTRVPKNGEKQVWLSPSAWQTILQVLEPAVVVPGHPAFKDVNGQNSPSKRMSVRTSIEIIKETLRDA